MTHDVAPFLWWPAFRRDSSGRRDARPGSATCDRSRNSARASNRWTLCGSSTGTGAPASSARSWFDPAPCSAGAGGRRRQSRQRQAREPRRPASRTGSAWSSGDIRDMTALRPDPPPGAPSSTISPALVCGTPCTRPSRTTTSTPPARCNFVGAAATAGVPRFVYVSSSEVYGTALWSADDRGSPDVAASPCTAHRSWRARATLAPSSSTYAYPTVDRAPVQLYGPRSHHQGDSGEVIPKFLLRPWPAGRWSSSATALRRVTSRTSQTPPAESCSPGPPTRRRADLNIGSGGEISINDLAAAWRGCWARDPAIVYEDPRPGDVLRLCADLTRARDVLGYEARVPLSEGLAGC